MVVNFELFPKKMHLLGLWVKFAIPANRRSRDLVLAQPRAAHQPESLVQLAGLAVRVEDDALAGGARERVAQQEARRQEARRQAMSRRRMSRRPP